ncbi:spindle pole body component 110 [Exaiptasia diaphana]|uniref:Uncharacterized protein n=1 Tax=Exaiptasia diaphana TaxID=2652724 RepID=A0A913WYP5_EXADI|nr:spindle pole body component 110 [Exaiptasia diaphana]
MSQNRITLESATLNHSSNEPQRTGTIHSLINMYEALNTQKCPFKKILGISDHPPKTQHAESADKEIISLEVASKECSTDTPTVESKLPRRINTSKPLPIVYTFESIDEQDVTESQESNERTLIHPIKTQQGELTGTKFNSLRPDIKERSSVCALTRKPLPIVYTFESMDEQNVTEKQESNERTLLHPIKAQQAELTGTKFNSLRPDFKERSSVCALTRKPLPIVYTFESIDDEDKHEERYEKSSEDEKENEMKAVLKDFQKLLDHLVQVKNKYTNVERCLEESSMDIVSDNMPYSTQLKKLVNEMTRTVTEIDDGLEYERSMSRSLMDDVQLHLSKTKENLVSHEKELQRLKKEVERLNNENVDLKESLKEKEIYENIEFEYMEGLVTNSIVKDKVEERCNQLQALNDALNKDLIRLKNDNADHKTSFKKKEVTYGEGDLKNLRHEVRKRDNCFNNILNESNADRKDLNEHSLITTTRWLFMKLLEEF